MSDGDEEICNASLKTKEGRCERPASKSDGRCGFHTADNKMQRDWKPNYKHGLYQDRGGYYKSLPEEDQKWIDAVADDLIRKSYFEKEDLSALEKCRQISIDLHQRRRADEHIAKNMVEEKPAMVHDEYGIVHEKQENVLFITKDRLSRESRMMMKDLGILDEDKSKSEEAAESLIESLSKDLDG